MSEFTNGRQIAEKHPHVLALDGIRGAAIALVLLFHAVQTYQPPGRLLGLVHRMLMSGWSGVDLFFVLSGYLITGILWDSRSSKNYFAVFYGRRTIRIFPLYYLVVAMVVLVTLIRGVHDDSEAALLRNQGWAWLYGLNVLSAHWNRWAMVGTWFNLSGFWSLAVEEHFYLIWPFLVHRLSRTTLIRVCFGLMGAAMVLRSLLFHGGADGWIASYALTPCRIDGMAAGAIVALAFRGNQSRRRLIEQFPGVFLACGLMLVGWFLATRSMVPWEPFEAVPGHTILCMFFAATIGYVVTAQQSNMLRRTFQMGWLRTLGKYSYGLYVYQAILNPFFDRHLPIEFFVTRLHTAALAMLIRTALMIGALFAVAFVSWHIFEKQWLRLKYLFVYRPDRSIPATLSSRPEPALQEVAADGVVAI